MAGGTRHRSPAAGACWPSTPMPTAHCSGGAHAGCAAQRLGRDPGTADLLEDCGFAPDGPHGIVAAHGCALDRAAGPAWLAAGDAALACDPLSSQGLLNALYSGLAAAEAADRTLAGVEAATGYLKRFRRLDDAYRRHLAFWYGLERRWADAPFWKRRSGSRAVEP